MTAPLLALHGSTDREIPAGQSDTLVKALTGAKKNVNLIRFASAGHGFSGSDVKRAFEAVSDFLQRAFANKQVAAAVQ